MIEHNLFEITENLKGLVDVPEIEDLWLKSVWISGRNAAANKANRHVRQNPKGELPFLKEAPKGVRQELGQTGADVWLNGYNAVFEYLDLQIENMIKYAIRDKVMVAL
jgi:hypothetical protein